MLGGRFMAWIERGYGRTALVGYLKDQGSSIWPYAPSWNGEDWFGGKSFRELWDAFREVERKAAEQHLAEVRARPAVPFTKLTALGGGAENPRFTPDGQAIVFFHRSLHERSGLWRVPASGGEAARAVKVDQNGTFAVAGPGRLLVAATEIHREFRAWDDLWLADLATGARRRLTTGERTTEPDLLPDGTVVHVRNVGDGGKALVRRRLDGDRLGPAEVLFEEAGTEVFNPRLSPDGKRVAFSLQRSGRLDLALWEDGKVRLLTDDDALDLTPAWSPDGATLYFASDRLGAFDVYALDPATGAARRVTNAETGALWPDVSPDGKTLAFLTYSRAGYDVATLALDPAAFAESPAPPAEPRPVLPAPLARLQPSESRPYSALGTLGPTFWFPVLSADATGNTYGLVTGGADVLVRHVWLAQGWWSEHGHTPGYSLTYQGRWSWPWLDLSTGRSVVSSPDPVGRDMDAWTVADAGATFTWSSMERSLALRLGWAGTSYDTHGTPPAELARPDLRFGDGFLSSATATLQYSDARRFVHSVSPEEGRTAVLSLRVAEPGLGSDYTLNRLRLSVSQYLRVPFTRHAVLMLRASGGVAHGHAGDSAPFSIGGPSTDLNVLDYLLGAVPDGGAHALRGYASGALDGTAYYLGTAELRFPIAETALGFSTWPVYLRRVHGAAFADAGDAFDRPGELRFAGETGNWRNTRVGVGGELRLEVVFGYNVRADVRIGVARPLGPIDGGRARDLRELGEAPGARFYVTLVLL
ncbi:MAG: BamA/TamA family outer membrane protein [Anaeromyxobacteraceae bacterium]